jgi:lipopolysaccharide export LptBFGC system permease protein LptF
MVLTRYFLKRFFKYVLAIGFFLAFLVNFIEFFEKIVHTKDAGLTSILTFIALNFVPTFFDLLGISSWLSTCLLIKEFQQQNEWETFSLLNIKYKTMVRLFLLSGFCLMVFSLGFKEAFIEKLAFQSEQYKMEKFKQKPYQKVIGKWLMLNKETIAYFGVLDLSTNSGSDMLLLHMNPDFTIHKVLNCKTFYINPESQELTIPSGIEFNIENNTPETVTNLKLSSQTLFSQIKISLDIPTLSNIFQNLLNKNILPTPIQNELIYNMFTRIISYLRLILYPILTFMLFMLFSNTVALKWVAIFFPYAIFTFISLLLDYLFTRGINPILFIFIYLLIVMVMLYIHHRINKAKQ